MIQHNSPSWGEAEAKAAYDVVLSGRLAAGERVLAVEREWARLTHSEDAAMVASGLSALRLALIALGVGPGDEVVIPAYSCTALHNAVLSVGAKYVLADIKADDLTIDSKSVRQKLTDRTKAIIAVHLFGAHADIAAIKHFGVLVIEDMAHGIFEQQGDLAISSFGPTKLIGSCYGGIVSGKKELIERVKDWRDYGDKPPSLRMNDLPNEISAAIALEQLKRLDETKEKRWQASHNYTIKLASLIITGKIEFVEISGIYRYIIRVPDAVKTAEAMQAKGVMAHADIIWDYRDKNWPTDLPNTDKAFQQVLSLPFWADITSAEQEQVIQTLGEVLD